MTHDQLRHLIADVKEQLRKRQFVSVLKWNRNQPRGPKGSPTGGRWVAGASAGTQGPDNPKAWQDFSVPPGMEQDSVNIGGVWQRATELPKGTGFRNAPRAENLPEHLQPPKPPTPAELQRGLHAVTIAALETGTPTDSRPLGDGGNANASIIVTLDDNDSTEAVYKPERGENWTASFANHDIKKYIKNRDFSLAEREAFASEVDMALGLDLVPPTVLRETVDETNTSFSGSGSEERGAFDSDELNQMYDSYKQKAQEDAMDAVGQEMADKYADDQKEHVREIENRVEELQEIWDEEKENFPDVTQYGSDSVLRAHPTLPIGSQQFERKPPERPADPLELLGDVDVTWSLNKEEKEQVRARVRQALEDGYRKIDDLDEDAAREHLDYDTWLEAHQDTENRLLSEKIQSFTDWKQSKGYSSGGGGGGSGADLNKNDKAPHPGGGSFQEFVDGASLHGSMDDPDDAARLAVLDYTIGTMDRHGRNLMYKDGRPLAIDNGYSMPAAPNADDFQFRSDKVKQWVEDDGGKISDNVREQISQAFEQTDWLALVDRHPGMNKAEKEAFLMRVGKMKKALKTPDGLRDLWNNVEFMNPFGW